MTKKKNNNTHWCIQWHLKHEENKFTYFSRMSRLWSRFWLNRIIGHSTTNFQNGTLIVVTSLEFLFMATIEYIKISLTAADSNEIMHNNISFICSQWSGLNPECNLFLLLDFLSILNYFFSFLHESLAFYLFCQLVQ